MSITAKELARELHLSATAVSMALNNKPGVSTQTRNMVIEAAEKRGYDFSKLSMKKNKTGNIYTIFYRTHNAILTYAPIFNELLDGIGQVCREEGYTLKIEQYLEKQQDLQTYIEDLLVSNCLGIILIGTEMGEEAGRQFLASSLPVVILDSYFESLNCNCVLINNTQGAYTATDYLISRLGKQPGYLRSSYTLRNFNERKDGFYKAVKANGMSCTQCIVHRLSPSIEGAFADMLEIIDRQDELAECYFADNDLIAIGAMKAFKLRGYRLPEDIGVIGFDNISEARIVEPSLTTVSIPRHYMGQTAARQLIASITNPVPHTSKIEVYTSLVKRFSV